MMVRMTALAGLDLGFRRQGGLGAVLQRGKRLKVSIEVDGGNGVGVRSRVPLGALRVLSRVWT